VVPLRRRTLAALPLPHNPANSADFARSQELPGSTRLRGGPGRSGITGRLKDLQLGEGVQVRLMRNGYF
jgi:hypothetical protein